MRIAGSIKRICVLPRPTGVGGMVSFKHKFASGLASRSIEVCYDLKDEPYEAILVVGGTRQLFGLWQARRKGIPVIQRLNGMNWLHRKRRTGLRHYLRSERGNLSLAFIRRRLARGVVYQSDFARDWWERVYGPTHAPDRVVLNGVNLNQFTPNGPGRPLEDRFRLLMVEGTLGGGYEIGLEYAIALTESVAVETQLPVELMVVGSMAPDLLERMEQQSDVPVNWAGLLPHDRIPEVDRSAHLLYSADVNTACPNSVIEALACGLPVLAFETGALPELVTSGAGRLVPYGGDPWQLDLPDMVGLAAAALEILHDQVRFREGARSRAERGLDLDTMVEGYLEALEEVR